VEKQPTTTTTTFWTFCGVMHLAYTNPEGESGAAAASSHMTCHIRSLSLLSFVDSTKSFLLGTQYLPSYPEAIVTFVEHVGLTRPTA
jgi:hypothetical protein